MTNSRTKQILLAFNTDGTVDNATGLKTMDFQLLCWPWGKQMKGELG